MPVIVSYTTLRQRLNNGITGYLQRREVQGDRDGLIHGVQGQRRAQLAAKYMEVLQPRNLPAESQLQFESQLGLLALMYAIFKPDAKSFLGFFPKGRSSRLAGLIADHMIDGDATIVVGGGDSTRGEISSEVFEQKALMNTDTLSNREMVSFGEGGGMSYLNRTKAVRSLIKTAIAELSPRNQWLVTNAGRKLQEILESSNLKKFSVEALPTEPRLGTPSELATCFIRNKSL